VLDKAPNRHSGYSRAGDAGAFLPIRAAVDAEQQDALHGGEACGDGFRFRFMHHLLDAFASSAARRAFRRGHGPCFDRVQGADLAPVRRETIRPHALNKRHMGRKRSEPRSAKRPCRRRPACIGMVAETAWTV